MRSCAALLALAALVACKKTAPSAAGVRSDDDDQTSATTLPGAAATGCPSVLAAGGELRDDGKICSPSGEFEATMQKDGNFVVYRLYEGQPREATWAAMTTGVRLAMQTDCNLVVYDADGGALFKSDTRVQPDEACTLEMQDDGNLVVYRVSHQIPGPWSTLSVPDKKIAVSYRPVAADRNTAKQEMCACINQFLPKGARYQPGTSATMKGLIEKSDWLKDCLSSEFKDEPDAPAQLPPWYRDLESLVLEGGKLGLKWGPLSKAFQIMNALQCGTRSVSMLDKFMTEQALAVPDSVQECRAKGGLVKWTYLRSAYNQTQKDVLKWLCSANSDGKNRKNCRDACMTQFDAALTWGDPAITRNCIPDCTTWCSDAVKGRTACKAAEGL
jgi:hypothetical protein